MCFDILTMWVNFEECFSCYSNQNHFVRVMFFRPIQALSCSAGLIARLQSFINLSWVRMSTGKKIAQYGVRSLLHQKYFPPAGILAQAFEHTRAEQEGLGSIPALSKCFSLPR